MLSIKKSGRTYERIVKSRNPRNRGRNNRDKANCKGSRQQKKVAVHSEDPNLDVKGACIGKNGMRIQSIIDELRGEKVDIVLWNEDIRHFVKNALNPSEVVSVEIIEQDGEQIARVEVEEDQLSLAIGKKGQNSRLAARLCGIKIDIHIVENEETDETKEVEEIEE